MGRLSAEEPLELAHGFLLTEGVLGSATLVGFLRGETMNVHSAVERIA